MSEIDVVDRAIIDADPSTVYEALLDEVRGSTDWWVPYWQAKPRGNKPVGQVGTVIDITVRHGGTTRLTAKATEIVEYKSMRLEFIGGDFVGEGEWSFEPANGGTEISLRWKVRPNRLLTKLVSRFLDIGKLHSEVMQAGFKGLNEYLKRKQLGSE
jgi:hypothetical protein